MRLLASLMVCFCIGCSQTPAPGTRPDEVGQPVPSVEAEKLHGDYSTNPIDADAKYLKKTVQVAGEVKRVAKDADGRYFVGLAVFFPVPVLPAAQIAQLSPREKKLYDDPSPMAVKCYVAPGKEAAFANLKPGQKAMLTGTCTGTTRNPPDEVPALLVVLENCEMK